jgi:hypothetical protein
MGPYMVRRMTQGVLTLVRLSQALLGLAQALFRLCSGMLTLGSGKSNSCSRPSTKTNEQEGKFILSLWDFPRFMESGTGKC